jgi:putative transposase
VINIGEFGKLSPVPIRSLKYRLYPTQEQALWLEGQLREACDLYNCALQERKDAWKTCRKRISFYDQSLQLKELRAQNLLALPNFTCAEEVLKRLDRAYASLFRRGYGFPRFRSSRRFDSFTFPKYGNGCKVRAARLYLQGCSLIKINFHRAIEGQIRTVTIKREAGRWFVVFSVQVEALPLPAVTDECGIDVGLSSFVAFSDGRTVQAPQFFRKAQAKLRRAQRHLARCQRGSNRRKKAVQRVARHHVRVRNQRADFHHKLSYRVVRDHQFIAVEDLNIAGMARSRFSKSINDAGWASFLGKLFYKAADAGRALVKVNARGTSQVCICGASVPKKLSDRWHSCKACGIEAPRDVVSAHVILALGRSAQAPTKGKLSHA